jgi:hypothetical protein
MREEEKGRKKDKKETISRVEKFTQLNGGGIVVISTRRGACSRRGKKPLREVLKHQHTD